MEEVLSPLGDHKYEYGGVPPLSETFAKPLVSPEHNTFPKLLIELVNKAGSLITNGTVTVQLLESFIVIT